MGMSELGHSRTSNPIDLVEQVAGSHDWAIDRASEDELTLVVAGSWADYHVSLNWREDLEALHIACAFEFKVPDNRLSEIYKLIESLATAGRSIIIVSSELPEVLRLSDNVIVMRAGAMVGYLSRDQLSEESIMSLAVTGKLAA